MLTWEWYFLCQDNYKVDEVFYVDEVVVTLRQLNQGLEKPLLYLLYGLNTDSDRYSKPADFKVRREFIRYFHYAVWDVSKLIFLFISIDNEDKTKNAYKALPDLKQDVGILFLLIGFHCISSTLYCCFAWMIMSNDLHCWFLEL